ncbi:MAG: alpha-amylase family glycosyl hydrolase, partial [Candidatus Izemoplasmatales bacterium]|nr:alpha-amylase family glycosyl hydrolase [Candidatus Izemoplasmatales bacterium]
MKNTKISQRNLVIYQVFVRNHTLEGTFKALIRDLDRIKSLGVDVVYLLPVHPIGTKNRKGTLGSPYSIQDYRLMNPELGSMSDFQTLIDEVHNRKMKIMMDEVFNHTSRDSRLLKEHPEWFYKNPKGEFANRVG